MLKNGAKIIRTAVLLFFAITVAYLIYQVIMALGTGYRTIQALPYTETEEISLAGYVVRDETVIPNTDGIVFVPAVAQGERVSLNQVIAEGYAGESSIAGYYASARTKEKLDIIEFFEKTGRVESDIALLNKNISATLATIAEHSADGGFEDISGITSELYTQIISRTASLSGLDAIREIKTGLTARYNSEKGNARVIRYSKAPASGYFAVTADGFESILKYKNMPSMTTEQFSSLKLTDITPPPAASVIGKMIKGFEWGYAATADAAEAGKIRQGGAYTLNLSGKSIDVTLTRIGEEYNGKVFLFFSSKYDISEISAIRKRSAEVVIDSYKGFKVPKTALRVIDGEDGVFVESGMQAKFKKVDILRDRGNYYIVAVSGGTSYLRTYDRIILNHKDLYDGKIINN